MTLQVGISVELTGKIADPRLERQIKDAINSGLHELAEIEGANYVRSQLYPGHGFRTGNLKNHINADIVGDSTPRWTQGRTDMVPTLFIPTGLRVYPQETVFLVSRVMGCSESCMAS